tara:strand:+ start:613 stop:813 length:201 start_codon:yes stop_codon:yes gene_type:complete
MDNVKKNMELYQDRFDALVQEKQGLVNRIAEINTAMEQLRGGIIALKGIEAPAEKKKKKVLKKDKK